MFETYLVPENTVITAKGDGPVIDISSVQNRTVLLVFTIADVVEQESIDLTVWGSPDEKDWGAKPLASYSQQFYCGEYPLLLDLAGSPDTKFLRAHWEVNRWGRGSETPMFKFGVKATEVAPEILRDAGAR